jgi:hypothetical protein
MKANGWMTTFREKENYKLIHFFSNRETKQKIYYEKLASWY